MFDKSVLPSTHVLFLHIAVAYPYQCTADLESEGGLILTNKKKVFEEAEQIAAAYRSKLGTSFMHVREDTTDYLDKFDESDVSYANWDWFKFEPDVRL